MQRPSISAEAYGLFNSPVYVPKVIEKTKEKKLLLREKVIQSFLFKAISIDDKNLDIIIDAFEEYDFKQGEKIIEQGDHGINLYLIDTGEAECYRIQVNTFFLIPRKIQMKNKLLELYIQVIFLVSLRCYMIHQELLPYMQKQIVYCGD